MALSGAEASAVKPDFIGQFHGDREARILIGVKATTGELRRGHAQVKHLEIECDDGTTLRRNLPQVLIRFRDGGAVFDGRDYGVSQFGQTFVQVHGRITANGQRAQGYAYWIEDVDDPNEAGHGDCSTVFPVSWKARAVR